MADLDTVDASVIKGGETPIEILLSRKSKVGLRLSVKAFPQIEDYMRALGTGDRIPVELSGRHWRPVNQSDPPLMAYNLTERLSLKGAYNLDALGQPLEAEDRYYDGPPTPPGAITLDGGRSNGWVNLSFLRLAGISEGAGVSFQVRGVYTTDAAIELGERLSKAAYRFFLDYLRPVDVIVKVSTQEVRSSRVDTV